MIGRLVDWFHSNECLFLCCSGEKGYHGTPSGIDNTAATFGGVLRFQRTDGDPIFVKKTLRSRILSVYASTGITVSTTEGEHVLACPQQG